MVLRKRDADVARHRFHAKVPKELNA
jgi:hypothetical protein